MNGGRKDAAAASVLVVCWSSGFVGAELATQDAPVETVLAWRTGLAAALLGGWALLRGERVRRASLLRQAVLGFLVQVVYLGGVFAAAGAGISAGTSALVAALQPLVVAALAGPLLGERTSVRQRVGLAIGASGVALVVAGDLGAGGAAPAAFLLPVVALAGLAAGTLLERRWAPSASLVVSLALQSAVAALVFGVVAGARGQLVPPAGAEFWTAMAWLVLLSTVGGYGSYLFVVRRSGATTASTLLYLTPPATALWAWAMFGQAPGPTALPGVLVCAVGVALALRRAGAPEVDRALRA
ncbi:DMT family transporter [Blastococcus sp. TBT05-19]|uniref:DMT family transporter n=1 Tax=Blastococcus sp. TBT05-19 TaxID=2250581 RepID=UPI00131472DD|nr:DMT family transporter [Blastococcus sp. TBT05-19]